MSTGGGVTTTTIVTYVLGVEEVTSVATSGGTTATATRYYVLPGGREALRDVSGLSYLATDLLGTPILTYNLDTGAVLGGQLRTPYGQARYSNNASGGSGGMHTTLGFTGQREDSAGAGIAGGSGLDYFNARYYDPAVGRFTSADTVPWSDPLGDAYAYVGGMVENATDPTGHDAGDPWWSPYATSEPSVTDPVLQSIVDQIWGHARGTIQAGRPVIGSGSTFDALRNEAATGLPTNGRWHYIKTQEIESRLFKWLTNNRNTADPNDVSAADALELDATDACVRACESPYAANIQGTPAYQAAQRATAPTGGSNTGSGGGGGESGGPGAGNPGGTNDPTGTGTGLTNTGGSSADPTDGGLQGPDSPHLNSSQDWAIERQQAYQNELDAQLDSAATDFTPASAPSTTSPGTRGSGTSSDGNGGSGDNFDPADYGLPEPIQDPGNIVQDIESFFEAFVDDGE